MGREIKRVPVDFDWPINKIWQGYIMPDSLCESTCEACGGRGSTSARQWVEQITALLLLLNTDLSSQAQGRGMHPYFTDTGSRAYNTRPSADIAEFCIGLAGRGEPGRWHDAIDNWRATERIIRAAGLDPEAWGICTVCSGHGSIQRYEGQRDDAEAWEQTEPPTGDGWQVWETVSEGSPISPVFAERESLIDWLMSSANSWGISQPLTREQAERFVEAAWAPTMVATPATGVIPGEQWAGGSA